MKDFRIRLKVAWSETDAARVVHFSNYFRYFERAELEFYDRLGFNYAKTLKSSTLWYPRVEAHCRYISPCEFNDELEVVMTLGEMKEKSIRYNMIVNNLTTQKQAAEGYVTIVAVDQKLGKAVPLPAEFARAISDYFS
ncbi:MAG: thioesterase family protein [Conexivisphaerales archaeon]